MKFSKILLIFILLLAFLVRLWRINNPVADWHSWRQSTTSAISRNFLKSGFDLLHPRSDNLARLSPEKEDNLEGYHFAEFPLYNLFQAGLTKHLSFFSLEIWGRLVSIFSSLLSTLFLYLIVKKFLNRKTALLAVAVFAFLPFNIYYSRTILPDPMMMTFSLGAVYFLADYWLLSAVFASLALLLKPFSVFIVVPAFYLLRNKKFTPSSVNRFFGYLLIWFLPFLSWRLWISQFPEGIPPSQWLFNTDNLRFSGAFFYWLFADRLGRLILGYWGLIPFGLGLVLRPNKKEGWFFHLWLASIFIYFWLVAGGNVQHDYYQILFLPLAATFFAKGIHFIFFVENSFPRLVAYPLFFISIIFSLAFSWYHVRDFFNINNPAIIAAGQAVDRLTPDDAQVIAPYGGDTAFLYQTKRRGWPQGIEIEKMIELGAEYYVNVNFDQETEWVMTQFCVLEKTTTYVVVKLKPCLQSQNSTNLKS